MREQAMASEPKVIDVSNYPDLLRLVDDIHDDEPRVLRRGGEDVAVLTLLPGRPDPGDLSPDTDDVAAFLAAAGGWRDLIDAEQFKHDVYAARGSDRPTVEL
jgi:hypothetical protein